MEKLLKNHNLYASITILFWSLAYLFTKRATESFTPLAAGLLRYLVATLVLIPVLIIAKAKIPEKRDLPTFAVSGFLGFTMYMLFFNTANSMLTGATCSIVIATTPVITAVLATFFYHEKIKLHQWIAFAISFAGVVALFLFEKTLSGGQGILWGLGAAIDLSVYNIWQKKLSVRYTGLETAAYSIFFGTLFLCVVAPTAARQFGDATARSLYGIVFLGIFSSAVSYVCWAKAFALAERTSDVSNYMFITPFLTTIAGFVAEGEKLSPSALLGGAMILGGVFLFQKDSFKKR